MNNSIKDMTIVSAYDNVEVMPADVMTGTSSVDEDKKTKKPARKKAANKEAKKKEPESYPPDYKPREEIEKMSDMELFKLAESAKGNTSEFSDNAKCAISYSNFTNILSSRGFKNGWYKPSIFSGDTVIKYKKPEGGTERRYLTIGNDTWEKWHNFRNRYPQDAGLIDMALNRFMDDMKSGRVKIELGGDYDESL